MNTKSKFIVGVAVCATLLIPTAYAGSHKGGESSKYKEHYKKRHQMGMDMMQMMVETMTILRDLNHKPSADEKARLSEMIKQMEMMMEDHKQMGKMHKKMGKHHGEMGDKMDKRHGKMMDDDDE